MKEIQGRMDLYSEGHVKKMDEPLVQERMDEHLFSGEQMDAYDTGTPPPVATPRARKIPEGSTVRRRLFADDGPAEPSRNPNMINSAADVCWMIQEEEDRAARRWNFDIQREEPIPNGSLSWPYPGDPRGDTMKRRMEEANARRSQKEIMRDVRYNISKLMEYSDPQYINAIGHLDNLANSLMDDSQEYYAESLQHWNFDFDNKMPAAAGGSVVWQQVGSHWVGNTPGTFTRLVLYPTKTENDENTLSHEESHEDPKKGEADESALKPTDEIEHLFTQHVNAIYGDSKREMTVGIKIATVISSRRNIDRDFLEEMRWLKLKNQHRRISKSEAIALVRGEETDQQNEDTDDDDDDYDYNIFF